MTIVGDGPTRSLSREAARALPAGAGHYTAYVGPPEDYDLMGATQFRLLTALGLREHHKVLDFGCGSLRAGRLLIPYLLSGCYHGLDPNRWLIDDAIDREVGETLVKIKKPVFRYDDDFSVDRFGASFDYILAQSIFSHMGRDVIAKCLDGFHASLQEEGLILATFVQPYQLRGAMEFDGSGWVYPDCVGYEIETIDAIIKNAGLVGRAIPWFHPRQTWFAIAHRLTRLPEPSDDCHLSGVVVGSKPSRVL